MKTSTGIAIALAIIIVVVGFFGRSLFNHFFTNTRQQPTAQTSPQPVTQRASTQPTAVPTSQQLSIKDDVIGTGAPAQSGDTVSVLYEGMLQNGKVFDSSKAHGNKPLSFKIGAHEVIPGMEQGVIGMKVGGTRTIIIPSALGYGPRGYGPIPGGATLIFKVQLVKETQ